MSEIELMKSIKKLQNKRFKELLKNIPKGQKRLVPLYYTGPSLKEDTESPYKKVE